jgi:hypothetical protein
MVIGLNSNPYSNVDVQSAFYNVVACKFQATTNQSLGDENDKFHNKSFNVVLVNL